MNVYKYMSFAEDRTRFETEFLEDDVGLGKLECYRRQYYPKFKKICRDFAKRGWFEKNSGNLSVLVEGDEMLITASNVDKAKLKKDDLVLVERFDLANNKVWVIGSEKPSSEVFMHHLIYQNHASRAIVHAHVSKLVNDDNLKDLRTSEFFDEGSIQLAHATVEKLRETQGFAILRDHGVVAYGTSLDDACTKILELADDL